MSKINTELFKKIDEVIKVEDGAWFEMSDWENRDQECGTTRCVAGWAVHFATDGASLYADAGGNSPEVLELAASLDVRTKVTQADGLEFADLEELGGKLLGLEGRQRGLFYTGNQQAAEVVELFANGQNDEALEVLDGRNL